jgi:NADPH2:quinone reductase
VRAVAIERKGGPEVMEAVDRPAPEPGPGAVLVELGAAGVNYRDVYERTTPGYGGEAPRILGVEGAGTVTALGEGVTELQPGDRVAWKEAPGSYAEQVVVAVREAVPIAKGVSDELAAAALLQGITAQYLTTSTYAIQPGDWVVVHAAAGGAGLLITQYAKIRGASVLATTSTEEKAELARGAGADEVVHYDQLLARAQELTGGAGVAAVYDGVGKDTFETSLEALRPRGTMVLFGSSSGGPDPFDPMRLARGGSLHLTRPTLVHYTATRDELVQRAEDVFELIAQGRLAIRIGGRYPLDDARRAHEDLEARRTTGKLVLIPG